MKYLLILLSFLFIFNVKASENNIIKVDVDVIYCSSSNDIWIKYDNITERITLLAYSKESGEYDNDIDQYTCDLINNANKISIEYDTLSLKKDKYNRFPVWLYVDDILIQELLIKKGYGQVDKVYDNYSYLDYLCDYQKEAIENKLGIWSYPNIKEAYCNSGVDFNNTKTNKEVEINNINKDNNYLNNIIPLNLFIVFLLLIFRKGYYEKR